MPNWQFDTFWTTVVGGFIVFGAWSASLRRRTARLAAAAGVQPAEMVLEIRRCRYPSRATVAGHVWRFVIFTFIASIIAGSIARSAPFGALIFWACTATGITLNGLYGEVLMSRWKRIPANRDRIHARSQASKY